MAISVSDTQRNSIKEDIIKVLQYSQNYTGDIRFDGIDKWLEIWSENKEKFYSGILHNQLIYEYGKVEFHVSNTQRKALLDTFISTVCEDIVSSWDPYTWEAFIDFIYRNQSSFFENVVKDDKYVERGAKTGMKLVKALKFFVPEDRLEAVQNVASTYIQRDKCSGILCFSIHPLDFLTASENGYNWRSCHALDGEYRAGNVSYMLDKVTMICYIKGEDSVLNSPRFPTEVEWNSKKWRMWLHINPQETLAFAGRQYPFFSDSIFTYIDKVMVGLWNEFRDEQVEVVETNRGNEIVEHGSRILPLYIDGRWTYRTKAELVRNGKNNLAYNDLLHSSCYEPFYSTPLRHLSLDELDNLKIVVGRQVPCACCGTSVAPESSSFLCQSCHCCYEFENEEEEDDDDYWTCDYCGNVFSGEQYYTNRDEVVCESCARTHYYYCNHCNVWVHEDDAHTDHEGVHCGLCDNIVSYF